MSEVLDVFSSRDSLIEIEFPTHICLFVSPSLSHPPARLLCGNVRVSGAVTQHSRWMATKRLHIYLQNGKELQRKGTGLKGEKIMGCWELISIFLELLLCLFAIM